MQIEVGKSAGYVLVVTAKFLLPAMRQIQLDIDKLITHPLISWGCCD